MAHEILIDLQKLVRNFDEIYAKVGEDDSCIKLIQGTKTLYLSKRKTDRRDKKKTAKAK